jgi:hypothetical protein
MRKTLIKVGLVAPDTPFNRRAKEYAKIASAPIRQQECNARRKARMEKDDAQR